MTTAQAQKEMSEPEVYLTTEGRAGVITLNRPKALNALSLPMIREIFPQLQAWEKDPAVEFVIIEGAGEKAFCAGGDVRAVYMARLKDDGTNMDAFFREEYVLNHAIKQFKKPYISLINGICMGGGMGLSIHGSHRVVTEKTVMAMPETGIGFFTDVGASHFLNKCPGQVGMFMGLTGERITGADALYAGLGTHYVTSDKIPQLRTDLLKANSLKDALAVLERHNQKPSEKSELQADQGLIDSIFTGKTVEEILEKLANTKHPKAYQWIKHFDQKSPTSMKVVFTLLKRTKALSLKKCLEMEFRVSQKFIEKYDFFEGVRAVLVDKDNDPRWQPRHLNQVRLTEVRSYFKDIGKRELRL